MMEISSCSLNLSGGGSTRFNDDTSLKLLTSETELVAVDGRMYGKA